MKDDVKLDELFGQISDLKKEIASLRRDLADKLQTYDSGADFAKIRSLLGEGVSVVTEAMRPIEEKITVHPLAAMTIALGAGIVIGRAACRFSGGSEEKQEKRLLRWQKRHSAILVFRRSLGLNPCPPRLQR